VRDATTDEDYLRVWWSKFPEANIAIATGSRSRSVILDVDPRRGGDASLRELERSHGALPDGPRVQTGGGGEHIYLSTPDNVCIRSRRDLLPGIDILAEGAYAVGAGSIHESGRQYRWKPGNTLSEQPLPPCPSRILELINKGARSTAQTVTSIPEGQRNTTLTSLGGAMRSHGFGPEAIGAALLEENRLRCAPPLDDDEVQQIAASVSRYPSGAIVPAKNNADEVPNLPFRTAEIERETSANVEFLVEPYLVAGATTEVVGKVKTAGKTTFVSQMCHAALADVPFMNKPTIKSAVVYLTEQNPPSFRLAMKRAGVLGHEDFVVLFWKDTIAVPWPSVMKSAVAECKKRRAKILVVDTLTQFAGLEGESENNAGDALANMRPVQQATAAGLGVLVVRHERKTGGLVGDSGRGSSAYAGAADIVLSLRRPEGNHPRNVRLLQGVSRFDGIPPELLIELREDGYHAIGEPGDVAVQKEQSDILTALPHKKKGALDIDALRKATGMSRARLQRRLDPLLNEGKVQKTGKGTRGKPIRYFTENRSA
jgi:hypothetical protein